MARKPVQNRNNRACEGCGAVLGYRKKDAGDPPTLSIDKPRYREFLTPVLLGYRIPSRGGM
ncbi:MAG: hypothetical protein AB8B85_12525 [Paracoccaceae bacterium]